MFSAPGAYLYAFTHAPRRQMLLSSVVAMVVMDVVTMAVSIVGVIISCSENLRVVAGGVGAVEYKGSPSVDVSRGGLVRVRNVG